MTSSRALPSTLSRRATLAGTATAALATSLTAGAASAAPERHHRFPGLPTLSPRQQAGQRVIASYSGLTPPPELIEAIRAGEIGGVIFFGENITSTAQIAEVTARLRRAHRHSPTRAFPLILTTDQEGGVVRRLKDQEPTLTAKQMGASTDYVGVSAASGAGAAVGLHRAGMNLNLAPVLDVYRAEGNFDDKFGRSFSSDPAKVAACGTAFLTAQQQRGIGSTVKHFPGLGAATVDQNTDLVKLVLTQSAEEIRGVDELPFRSAVKAGVDLVMTSWAVYPALDPTYPAGLSRRIVQGELRDRLRFRGVTITDALEAGSLGEFGEVPQRAVSSADAGMDVLLASSRQVADGLGSVTALTYARQDRRLGAREWDAALQRVMRLRWRLRTR
ncbi:beta-N-acetylhexosaminidase [Nocardioides mangrovicus]|uniref:Beta-N-acetylhexosaminidase n=1 Tax=Nocardioides mangrovicus TaxID=2478913 RepID=A0A3L8P080_9ACTN|nr:glycoside hydrolase family 3 N-terminal domain-containing protein [Nocardioides mangrovicus]RLV48584.1 beta-N-acetylhexosaminidase [Nocardioides mangrovicus]